MAGWRAMSTLKQLAEARLAQGRRLGMLLLDAGAMDPIQFRPAATSQPGRAGPLS